MHGKRAQSGCRKERLAHGSRLVWSEEIMQVEVAHGSGTADGGGKFGPVAG